MPRESIPETTQQAVKRDYRNGAGSMSQLASKYNISRASVGRILKGIKKGSSQLATDVVATAVASGHSVTVGDVDLTEYVQNGIKDLTADITTTEAKSKEGLAQAALKYMQFYAQLHPPTLEDFVDQLLARPDFNPDKFISILQERYAAKAS